MSWTKEVFLPQYKDKLNGIPERNRGDGFQAIFEALELKELDYFTIVETGSMRPGFTIEGDGQSTQLFDKFVNHYAGKVISVDLNLATSDFASNNTSKKTLCYCEDSVKFLWYKLPEFCNSISLFYLDSYDVEFSRPIDANLHHMKELVAISKWLKRGTLVAVDDCRFAENDVRIPPGIDHKMVGKGTFVQSFMENIGATLLFDGYQKLWRI